MTGKVTGEHFSSENHRALDNNRTVAPYRRDPTISSKVSQAAHPAYRPQTRPAMQMPPAGATSRDLAEHEVQSQYVANAMDVGRAVTKSTSHHKFQQARALTNDGMVGEPPLHREGWESAIRAHRAYDGAYGATSLEFNQQAAPNELGKQRVVKGREAHEASVGAVVFNESEQSRASRVKAAEWVGGGGGGAYKSQAAYSGAAGLNSSENTQVRNRERWAKAGASQPKGMGMQPAEVFNPVGGVVYGGATPEFGEERGEGQVGEARRSAEYYRKHERRPGGAPAGIKTMHQTGNGTASETILRSPSKQVRGATGGEVGGGLGHGVKPVYADAFDGALGATTRQINSSLPELKSSLTAEGAIRASAESALASSTDGGGERKTRFGPDVPEVVFGQQQPPMSKGDEVKEMGTKAGADTHMINRRNLNTRYHDTGRYGRFGTSAPPQFDASVSTVNEVLFSAPKPQDFDAGAGPLEGVRGANRRLSGAAGMTSSAAAECEPLMRYRSRPDQTDRQRRTSEANAASFSDLHFAPQVEDVAFGGANVSKLNKPTVRGELFNHRENSPRGSRAGSRAGSPARAASPARGGGGGAAAGRSASPRPGSPRGGGGGGGGARPSSPRGGAPRQAWAAPSGGGRNSGTTNAAGTTTHELAQKDQAFGGPGGPDHVPRGVRSGLPNQAHTHAVEAEEVMRFTGSRSIPDQTVQMRGQPAYSKAAGASTQEVEQQMGTLPAERNKQRGGAAQGAAQKAGGASMLPGGGPPQLFERSLSSASPRYTPRGSRNYAAGLNTGKLAASEPYFLCDLDAGVKLGATHPSRFGEVVFGVKSPASRRAHGDVELKDAPEYRGRLGISSHKYGARDPLLVGDQPPGNESAASTTWKSQVDEVLYGQDLDGSGDYAAMDKAITQAPQFKGAAGVSSLAHAYDEAEHSIDVNTRIDTTYAEQAGVPPAGRKPGSPIREPIKVKRMPNPKQAPELFSKAGVADWMNKPRGPGQAPGKDEAWRPWHRQGAFFYSG